MLEVDHKRVARAEPSLEVSIEMIRPGDKQQFAILKQSALFHRNNKEHHIETRER